SSVEKRDLKNCPDCGVLPGNAHLPGCDVARCSHCGRQYLQCQCPEHDPQAAYWTGEWPDVKECQGRGWRCVLIAGKGWRPCDPETPDATEDLNRLTYFRRTGRDGLYDKLENG